ncbi:MAG: ABC transporter permease [Bacillota bacterium]|jgi:oligopeptide transport system permease protein
MVKYLLDRIVSAITALLVIVTVTFFLMHAIPGGPFTEEKAVSPEITKNIEERYHVNDPIGKQYLDYLSQMVRLDLGWSFKYPGRKVNDLIAEGFPVSAIIGLLAILVALGLGVPAGILSALRHNHWQDNLVMLVAIIGVSVPSFIMATLLQYIFAYKLRWLPASLFDSPKYVILPVLALSGMPLAFFARLIRSSMLETLSQDYIRTARAKGLGEAGVVLRHALKNALIPLITVLGPMAANLLTGTFIIEKIFVIRGLGRHFVNSIYNRDYTTIMGLTVFYAMLLLAMNLLVDLACARIDPRIKLAKES